MIFRFLRALFDYLFGIHGYVPNYDKIKPEFASVKYKVAKRYKCKVCNNYFWAMKKNDTCHNIKCFFSYRMGK